MEKKNALLIDDDDIANFLNERVVASTGLINRVHTANNGKEALDIFNQYFTGTLGIPDVILLDLNMPVMDGFTFIQAFNNLKFPNKEKVLIIVVTSSHDPDDVARAKAMGIEHYLQKPITKEAIEQIIMAEFV